MISHITYHEVSTYLCGNHWSLSWLGIQKKPWDIFVDESEPWVNAEGKWPLISMLNGGNPRRPGKVSSFHMSMLMAVSPMWPEKVSNSHLVGRRISEWPEKVSSVQIYLWTEGSPEWARKRGLSEKNLNNWTNVRVVRFRTSLPKTLMKLNASG